MEKLFCAILLKSFVALCFGFVITHLFQHVCGQTFSLIHSARFGQQTSSWVSPEEFC